jgi:aryl-alcohol dehydrogenase-like predicted oxidoreductase
LAYNLLFRAIEYGIQSACAEKGLSILCYSPLAQGLLTGKFASADEVPAGRARTRHFSKNRAGTRHGQEGCEAETFPAVERIRSLCRRINEPMDRVSLAWLLHQPGVASVLAGARNPAQIQKNAAAGDLELSADVLRELTEITDELKRALGPNPDMWQGESRIR